MNPGEERLIDDAKRWDEFIRAAAFIKSLKESNAELLEERDYHKGMTEYLGTEVERIRKERNIAQKESIEAKNIAKKVENEKKVLLHFLTLKHLQGAEAVIMEALGHFLSGEEITWDAVSKEVSKVYLRQILRQGEELNLD